MSHFAVLVVGDDVDGQLAPYDENIEVDAYVDETFAWEDYEHLDEVRKEGEVFDAASFVKAYAAWTEPNDLVIQEDGLIARMSRYNTLARWDWWVEGGRYDGRLFHRDGRRVNSLRKGDLDLETMRTERRHEAALEFRKYARLAESFPPPRPWAAIREAHGEDIDAARIEWNTHPFVKGMREAGYWVDDLHEEFLIGDPDAERKYLARAEARALSAWAVVKDGEWTERGEMGWFGMSANEMDEDEWRQQVLDLVAGLPDDTLLTMIDCHI